MKHISSESTASKLTNVIGSDVQPNATDLRLKKVLRILDDDFVISNEDKKLRSTEEVQVSSDGYFHLELGDYEVVMENNIHVGKNEAGFVITRSTLNRSNVFLTSGLFDSMFCGSLAAVMHVGSGKMKIKPGTRIGQYIMWSAEMLGDGYDGDYGFGKEHETKYM